MNAGFRPASRSEAKPLIGLYAESGNGKTWSALLLARGFVGPNGKIGMIETEGGRGEANVGREPVGHFLVRPIRGDFSPQEYGKAIDDAEKEGLAALIIDSASHEWEGAGGVLAMAAKNDADGKKGVLIWQQPKISHQRHFMLRLMQTPIPLVIVCMRAKYPMVQKGSNWTRSEVLEPKQADDILFEMFVHGWIDAAHKFHSTKYTLPELADIVRDNEPISIATGQRLADWAKGSPAPGRTIREPDEASVPAAQTEDMAAGADVSSDDLIEWDKKLGAAAAGGIASLAAAWKDIPKDIKPSLEAAKDRRHKPRAAEVDAARR